MVGRGCFGSSDQERPDKKSLEQRPECSEGGGPCRGKVRVRVGSGGQVFQSETGVDLLYLRNN